MLFSSANNHVQPHLVSEYGASEAFSPLNNAEIKSSQRCVKKYRCDSDPTRS